MVIFCLFFMFCSFCAKKFSLKRQQWCVVIFRIASSKWMLETVAVYALCAHLYDRNWECVYLCEWVCLWCGLDVIRNEYKCASFSCILEFYSKFCSAGEKLRYANTVHYELTWLALAALRAKYSNPINSISMEICQEHTHQPISVPTRPSWKHGEKLGKRKE